ncbi:MAG: TIM barrel protein [Spirochaetia bacterium]
MRYRFPLSFQTTLPDDYREHGAFLSLLKTLRGLGFLGVELNMSDPRNFQREAIEEFLGRHDLRLSMLATGLTAKRLGLSLSHPDELVRRRSVDICKHCIDWVAGSGTGVIVGFLKGGVVPDAEAARGHFARSLAEVAPYAAERSVAVLIEATNRYESSVANTIEEAAACLQPYDAAYAQLLPDTFHMNIEEANMFASLDRHRDRFRSFHLSDNTRFFPGFGAIDFGRILGFLTEMGYRGQLAIEGNVRSDIEGELHACMARLAPLLEMRDA